VILVARVVSAQNAATAKDVAATAEPTIAPAETSPISACGERECPEVTSASTIEKPTDKHALLKQKLAELNCLQSEIDTLRAETGTPQAVLAEMEVIEVSRTKLRELGVDFDDSIATGHVSQQLLDVLKKNNVAKVISRPKMMVTCGRSASFIVGGEVPLPTVPGSEQAVEFKRFGTEIELRARVSEMDATHTIEVAGKKVPRFAVRQVDSTVDTELGKTVVISGSVQRRQESIQVGDKVKNVENEVELVFLLTPHAADGSQVFPTSNGAPYRTATSTSEAHPAERSLRVTKPNAPR
jgi:Flp pilus assembly secretin CpaC